MSREEEKYQAAENAWNLKGIKNKEQKIPYKLGFLEGFDYADQNPREGLWDAKKVTEWLKKNCTYTHPRKGTEECFIDLFALKDAMEE